MYVSKIFRNIFYKRSLFSAEEQLSSGYIFITVTRVLRFDFYKDNNCFIQDTDKILLSYFLKFSFS